MRVPARRSFDVLPGGGSAGRLSDPGSGRLASIQGREQQQFGQTLQGLGAVLGQEVENQQYKINQARVRETALQFRADIAEAEKEYLEFKGAELVAGKRPVMRGLEERLSKRRNELLEGISSPAAKEAFGATADDMFAGWSERAGKYEAEQTDFYIEQQRDGVIQANLETAISRPEARGESLSNANDVLREKFEDQGFDGERLDQKARAAMGELLSGQISVLLDADRIDDAQEVVDAARGMVSADVAEAMGTSVKKKAFTRDVNAKAADVWDVAEGDYDTSLKMAGMIENPEMQEAVKSRLNTLKARDTAAEAQATRDATVTAWESLEQGGLVDALPRDVWEQLGPQTRIQMRTWEEAQAKRDDPKRETDLQTYNDVYSFLDTGDAEGALSFLNGNADKLSKSDYKSLRTKVSTAMDDDGATVESVRSVTQVITNALDRSGVNEDNKGGLLLAYDHAAQQYQREHGEEPSDEWRDKTIERLAAKIKVTRPNSWFNDTTGGAFEIEEIGEVPERHVQAVLMAFGSTDKITTISEDKLNASYSMAMAYFRINGINDPSDESITDMIMSMQEQSQ